MLKKIIEKLERNWIMTWTLILLNQSIATINITFQFIYILSVIYAICFSFYIYIYILSVIYAIQSCQVVTHDETFLTTPHLGQFVVFDYNLIENLKLDYNKT